MTTTQTTTTNPKTGKPWAASGWSEETLWKLAITSRTQMGRMARAELRRRGEWDDRK